MAESDSSPKRASKPVGVAPGASGLQAAKFSELDLADAFVQRAQHKWRHVLEWRTWFRWDDRPATRGWHEDTNGSLRHDVGAMLKEAIHWPDSAVLSPGQQRKLCSNGFASGVMAFAGAHPAVSVAASQWDTDTMALGVPGGVVDLRTGRYEDASPDVYVSRRCAIRPAAGVPRLWLSHLNRVMHGDRQMVDFLQRYFGYTLTGEVGEHSLLFLYGTGRNGKGTIVETLVRLMGDYGYAAPVNLLMESKQERHPVELAMLRGRRIVSCSEPPQGSKWDDGKVRWLTGGDTISARKMGENLKEFEPTHKLVLMGNHKPTLRSVDEAMKSRFNIIDFSLMIPREERDPKFLEKLRAEWPQILQWMIDGCLMWQESGLGRPAGMVEATEEYLQDEDSFGQFLGECCEVDLSAYEDIPSLFRAYAEWCERVGERGVGRKAFRSILHETPGVSRRRGAVPESVDGLRLKESARKPMNGWKSGGGSGWLDPD